MGVSCLLSGCVALGLQVIKVGLEWGLGIGEAEMKSSHLRGEDDLGKCQQDGSSVILVRILNWLCLLLRLIFKEFV